MRPSKSALIAITLAATSLASTPAAASSSAFATLTDFSWQLIDLTPDDALGVSITFSGGSNAVQASNFALGDFQNGAGALSAIATGGAGLGWATGLVSLAAPGQFSLTATSSSTGNYVFATGDGSRYVDFILSGGTQVVFTAQASVWGAFSHPEFGEDATSFVRLQLEAPSGTWAGFSVLESDAPTLLTDEAIQQGATGVVKTGTVSVSFSNTAFESITGNLRQQARSVTINAAPVPEPHTWAMLLVGLMAVGTLARRGQR